MKSLKGLEIDVTQRDINRGIPYDNCNCPIALAIRRVGKFKENDVSVEENVVEIGTYAGILFTEPEARYALPKRAQTFVARFDNEEPVKPFSFVLR